MQYVAYLARMKKTAFICIGALCLIGIFLYYHNAEVWRHTFHVTFLNIGQGDSALVQFANGQTMLVDCGPNSGVLSRLGKNLPVYISTIDYVLVTHPDLDHYGGCVDVLRRYRVKHIIVNGHTKTDGYFKTWENARRGEPGADTIVASASSTWHIGSSTIQFFSPDVSLGQIGAAGDSNNYSIVFRLTSPSGETFLFTGDMEEPLENALLLKYCNASAVACPALESNVLKVGHHGSNSSSGENFLAAVHARVAIVSVGKNKFGHPSLRVLKHVERSRAQILRTDELGDIVIR